MVPLAEAADVLGVPEDTLRWAGDAGDIPLRRIGTRRLLPAAWLESVTAWDPRPGEVT